MKRNNIKPYLLSILIILSIAALAYGNYYLAERIQIRDKFAVRYSAAKLWMGQGISPYSDEVSTTAKMILDDRAYPNSNLEDVYLIEPVYFTLLFLPISLLQFDLARAVWQCIIEISIIFIVLISLKLTGWKISKIAKAILILLGLGSTFGLRAVLFGDPIILSILLFLLSIYLVQIKQETTAGLILALASFSNEFGLIIVILLIAWSISHHNYALIWSYLAGILFLFVTSLLLFGNWFPEWLAVIIKNYPGFDWVATPLMRISTAFKGANQVIGVLLHLGLVIYLLLEWFGAFGKTGKVFVWKISLTLVIVYLLNVFSKPSTMFILIPGIFFFLRFLVERWKIVGKILSWLLILGLVAANWLIFQSKGDWFIVEPSANLLLMPLITILGLQWTRWWALKLPSPPDLNF